MVFQSENLKKRINRKSGLQFRIIQYQYIINNPMITAVLHYYMVTFIGFACKLNLN